MSESQETSNVRSEQKSETENGLTAKMISKIFKFLSAFGIIACAILKWLSILPDAGIGEICTAWAVVYGIGAGTIDANIMIDKFVGKK